jgi:hypothetical protein
VAEGLGHVDRCQADELRHRFDPGRGLPARVT